MSAPTPVTGNTKPSLTGVRIKQRKGVAKATAKFEPEVFRDALLSHLLPIPPTQYDLIATKLITAGSTLEFLKYSDALFEIVFVGGILQPGGSYVEDGKTERSPFAIIGGKDEIEGTAVAEGADQKDILAEVTQKVEVMKKVIQRYKYLQKPLEQNVLPALLQYIIKWTPLQREKVADAAAMLIAQGFATGECLLALTKDHLVKDSISLSFLTHFIRAYLTFQNMEHLSRLLRSSFKDIILVFPQSKRTRAALDAHFKAEGLPQVAEWYGKRQTVLVKEELTRWMTQACEEDEFTEEWVENALGHVATQQVENSLPTSDVLSISWNALMASFDWAGRSDQFAKIKTFFPVLAPFAKKPLEQVNLLQIVQVYCYDEQKAMKSFPSLVRILWEADLVSDNALIYWFDKGAKPQGKEYFVKSVQALYDHVTEESDDEEDE
ncbi:hypothetical protein BDY24DRAFT_349433 [Mrakia frigida]|uniref:uncharacterized protein n=1 Tax=Mrakia frigida TaxID=29902 RepID=UPI003FCBFB56